MNLQRCAWSLGIAAAAWLALPVEAGVASPRPEPCTVSESARTVTASQACEDLVIPEHGMIHVDIPEGAGGAATEKAPPVKPEDRVARLEAEVKRLAEENKDLRSALGVLKGQVNALMTQLKKLGERVSALDGKGGGPRG